MDEINLEPNDNIDELKITDIQEQEIETELQAPDSTGQVSDTEQDITEKVPDTELPVSDFSEQMPDTELQVSNPAIERVVHKKRISTLSIVMIIVSSVLFAGLVGGGLFAGFKIYDQNNRITSLEGEKSSLNNQLSQTKANLDTANSSIQTQQAELSKINDELTSKKAELATAQIGIDKFKKVQDQFSIFDSNITKAGDALDSMSQAIRNNDQASYSQGYSDYEKYIAAADAAYAKIKSNIS